MEVPIDKYDNDHAIVKNLRLMRIGRYMDTTAAILAALRSMGNVDVDKFLAAVDEVGKTVVEGLSESIDNESLYAIALRVLATDMMLTAEVTADRIAFEDEVSEIEEGTCE